jgi:hypothetical protein
MRVKGEQFKEKAGQKMRLSDAIDQLAQGTAPNLPPEARHNRPFFIHEVSKNTKTRKQEAPCPKKKEQPRRQTRPRTMPKPERLAFLHPCPICSGRSFVAGNGGGFFCTTCQPGIEGHPVEATGKTTRKARPALEPMPAMDHNHLILAATDPQPEQVTAQQREFFQAAWPWIKENKAQLTRSGWTMAALVSRSKFRWPCGRWGLAWLPVWKREQLQVTINDRGSIVFTFRYCGKIATQTAKPQVIKLIT